MLLYIQSFLIRPSHNKSNNQHPLRVSREETIKWRSTTHQKEEESLSDIHIVERSWQGDELPYG